MITSYHGAKIVYKHPVDCCAALLSPPYSAVVPCGNQYTTATG